ncbi:hypothetical protein RSAG8_06527, partial [Rhizoctonia solani AG-8 WAC10335]
MDRQVKDRMCAWYRWIHGPSTPVSYLPKLFRLPASLARSGSRSSRRSLNRNEHEPHCVGMHSRRNQKIAWDMFIKTKCRSLHDKL